jgi:hypothetical protein
MMVINKQTYKYYKENTSPYMHLMKNKKKGKKSEHIRIKNKYINIIRIAKTSSFI